MRRSNRLWRRLIVLATGTVVLAAFGARLTVAQDVTTLPTMDDITGIKVSIDTSWVMLTGFLVFFMQCGFALLETGLIRQTGAVNALLENFIDAGLTALVWWGVGFGIAFGADNGSGLLGTTLFFPGMNHMAETYPGLNISVLTMFFFQFAFAATASTITTGAMAERTDFLGDLIYSALIAIFIYPVIAHWVWGSGWLFQWGFHDFAGSTVVHTVGGVIALIGAWMLGPRPGRVWGSLPKPHNLAYATLGTMVLWFGWYGFNPGSTLGLGNPGLIGLVTLNTTLGAATGSLATMFFVYSRTGRWDLSATLNGSLAGLVAVTAGCAFIEPWAAVVIGLVAGVLVILAADLVETMRIDDAVGAFAVHGACGIWGTLSIGLFAQGSLTFAGAMAGKAGLFAGGGLELLGVQALGSLSTVAYVGITSVLMFGLLKAINRLRVSSRADVAGIDAYEHGASIWPDVLPMPEDDGMLKGGVTVSAPAVGD
ncbi:MAG: ammonium transporter [Chloroflexi bacterium]|nr:ammonium transporter [Chloroflexota bacterium]